MPMIEIGLQHQEIMPYFCREEMNGGLGYRETQPNVVSNDLFIPSQLAEFVEQSRPNVWANLVRRFKGDRAELTRQLVAEVKARLEESSNVAVFFNKNKTISFQGETVPLFFVSGSALNGDAEFKKNIFAAVEELPVEIRCDGIILQKLRPDITFFLNGIFIGYCELKSVTNGQRAADQGRGKIICDYLESVRGMADRSLARPKALDERKTALWMFEKGIHITTTDVNETYVLRNIGAFYDESLKGFLDRSLTVGQMRPEIEKVFKIYPVTSKLLTNTQKFYEVTQALYSKKAIEHEILYYNFLQYKYVGKAHRKVRNTHRGVLISPRPKQKFGCDKIINRIREMLAHEAEPDYYRNKLKKQLEALGCTPEKVKEVLDQRDQYCNNKYVYSLLMQYAAGFGKSNIIGWTALQLKDLRHDGAWAFDKILIVVDRLQLRGQIDTMMMSMNIDKSMFTEVTKQDEFVAALTDTKRIIVVNIQKFLDLQESLARSGAELKKMRCAFLIDEIHRSNTGESHEEMINLFEKLQDGINGAATKDGASIKKKKLIIGFTATPTERVLARFGEFKSASIIPTWVPFDAYTMREAIDDGYVLDPTKHIIPVATSMHFDLPEGVDPNSEKGLAAVKKLVYSNPERMQLLSKFIVERLVSLVYTKIHGTAKAMLAVSTIPNAIAYCTMIRKELAEKCAPGSMYEKYADTPVFIVYSDNQENEASSSLNNGDSEQTVIQNFKLSKNGLMIVVDKLQTGFDEPKLHTLFLDKEISGINAIQTICRVNRTCKCKEDCHIVDLSWKNVNCQNIKEAFKKYEGILISDFNPLLAAQEVERLYRILLRSEPSVRWYPNYRKLNNDPSFVLKMEDDIRQWIRLQFERTVHREDLPKTDAEFMQVVNEAKELRKNVGEYGDAITSLKDVLDIDKKYNDKLFLHFWEVYSRIYRDVMREYIVGGGGVITPVVTDGDVPGILVLEDVPPEEDPTKEAVVGHEGEFERHRRNLLEIIQGWNAEEELTQAVIDAWLVEIGKMFEFLRTQDLFVAMVEDDHFTPEEKLKKYSQLLIGYKFKLSRRQDLVKVNQFKKLLDDNAQQLLDVFMQGLPEAEAQGLTFDFAASLDASSASTDDDYAREPAQQMISMIKEREK